MENVIAKMEVGGVKYSIVVPSGLTPEQQAQIRANIGAISAAEADIVSNGTYPEMTVGNATHAQTADNATNAVNALRATADANGNNIQNTYLTRQQIIDLFLPVGRHWKQYQGEPTPAALFGHTWEIDTDYTGRVLVGSGTGFTIGATGGSADAVVVDHTHTAKGVNESQAATTGDFRAIGRRCTDTTENNVDFTECVSSTGVSGAGKNMQPYKVVAIWKRTA